MVKKNGKIDFKKVSSLPGTFVVNRYSKELEALSEPSYGDEDPIHLVDEYTVTESEVDKNTRTYITHDKGGSWHLL